jgi:hypothetical protein
MSELYEFESLEGFFFFQDHCFIIATQIFVCKKGAENAVRKSECLEKNELHDDAQLMMVAPLPCGETIAMEILMKVHIF